MEHLGGRPLSGAAGRGRDRERSETQQPDPRPRQSRIANVLLGLGVSAALLTGAEGLARRLEKPGKVRAEARHVAWDGGGAADFYVMKSTSVGWPPHAEFNRDGVRDRAHASEKPEGVRRVVCLGDSVTLGPDRHPEQAYPQVLQARLDALGPDFEVFNVSFWGWSTRQERIAYERIVRRYGPDQVLLGVCLNDISDLGNDLARPPALLLDLYRRSALLRRLADVEGREIRGLEELFTASGSPKVRAGFERFFEEVAAQPELGRSLEGRARSRPDGPRAAAAVPALRGALSDENEHVRREAARALGRIGPDAYAAVAALRRAEHDPDVQVRETTAEALRLIGAKRR